MANNLDSAKEMNKLLEKQNKLMGVQAKMMKGQVLAMKALVDAMRGASAEDMAKSFKSMTEAIKEGEKAVDSLGKTGQAAMNDMAAAAEDNKDHVMELTSLVEKLGKKSMTFAGFLGFFSGISSGARLAISGMSSLLDVVGEIGKALLNLGVSIITAPFKMLNGLMSEAASGGGSEFRTNLEAIRKEFGDLSSHEGKAIIGTFRNMRGELENTGLSVRRIFGTFAERLKAAHELAQGMGRQFTSFSGEIEKHAEAVLVFAKGLGLEGEKMAAFADLAASKGKSLVETGTEITSMAFQMGDAFGLSG